MMKNDIFNDLTFNTGWKTSINIKFLGNEYNITLKFKAYFETDLITNEQKESYLLFSTSKNEYERTLDELVHEYDEKSEKIYIPETLLIDRDGSTALLCQDNLTLDEGIAICLLPDQIVLLQSEYL